MPRNLLGAGPFEFAAGSAKNRGDLFGERQRGGEPWGLDPDQVDEPGQVLGNHEVLFVGIRRSAQLGTDAAPVVGELVRAHFAEERARRREEGGQLVFSRGVVVLARDMLDVRAQAASAREVERDAPRAPPPRAASPDTADADTERRA